MAKAKDANKKIAQLLMPFQKLAVLRINKGIEIAHAKDAAAEKVSGGFDKPWLDIGWKACNWILLWFWRRIQQRKSQTGNQF